MTRRWVYMGMLSLLQKRLRKDSEAHPVQIYIWKTCFWNDTNASSEAISGSEHRNLFML